MLRARRWMQDERGATAIEYALLAGIVGGAIMISITTLGGNLSSTYSSVAVALEGRPPPPPPPPAGGGL